MFFLILLGYGVSYVLSPSIEISESEKRKLAQLPSWSFDSYLSGVWIDSVDKYVNDQAPFRLASVKWASVLDYHKGFHPPEKEKIVTIRKPPVVAPPVVDTAAASRAFLTNFDEVDTSGLLIVNGSVFTLNSGSVKMSRFFAKMLNAYARELQYEARVFSCVPPLSSAFIPVKKYEVYNRRNQATLLGIRDALSDGAFFCDVLGELNKHTDKKLFFSTDHHWTAYGAYYAYVAFCRQAGFEPVPLEAMTKKVKYRFLGSLYQMTRDVSVEKNPDTLDYFMPRVETEAVVYRGGDLSKPAKSYVFCERYSGGLSYTMFLCGDLPLIKIKTNVGNGKKALVIKNSMGNAFSVFLISHYEELYVMDYRYSEHNVLNLIRDNGINDLIFAPSMYAANVHGTINRMYDLGFNNGKVRLLDEKARQEKALKEKELQEKAVLENDSSLQSADSLNRNHKNLLPDD